MANQITNDQLNEMCERAGKLGFRPERIKLLDQRLTEWSMSDITPSIAVKVLRHGEVAFEGAYGTLGPGKAEDSLTVNTIFPVCSHSKPVVSTLLAIMQEEGLIDFNEPVRRYIPEFTGDKDWVVRIWHLLTHTSGISDTSFHNGFQEYVTNTLGFIVPEDKNAMEEWNQLYLQIREKMGLAYMEVSDEMREHTRFAVCLSNPPSYKVHSKMAYSNVGYNILTRIIRIITGMDLDEYATLKLFRPLKMIDSHYILPDEKLSRYVTRAEDFVGSWWLNEGVIKAQHGSGGLKTTVSDLTRFGQMFLNKGSLDGEIILSPASIREITYDHNSKVTASMYNGEVFDSTWGFGWNIRGDKKDDSGVLRSASSFEHGGFGCCKILCDPEMDLVSAFFTVCKTDNYYKAANFHNMILGAICK